MHHTTRPRRQQGGKENMDNSKNKALRRRRRTLKLDGETVRPVRDLLPYTPPQLISWGTLVDLTQGGRGRAFDFVPGTSRAV